MATKDPITCHVLDTLTGRPAPGINVSLQFDTTQLGSLANEDSQTETRVSGNTQSASLESGNIQPSHLYTFKASTNSDGRIANWTGPANLPTIGPAVDFCRKREKVTVWTLIFDTGSYYGEGNTFWPEVQLTFSVKPGEHYHVPLLLGPFSYTTYRGS